MNNDKKATYLGLAKAALIAILTIFFARKISDITGVAELAVYAVGVVWSSIEGIIGKITNKPEKE